MNKLAILLVLLLPTLLNGCAIGYQARGSLSDVAGEMRGKGYPGKRGGGHFIMADGEGRLRCDGQAAPPTHSPTPDSCAGETGEGLVRCTDGREIPIRWEAISCRSWQGSGTDRNGNRLLFRVERR